MRSGSQGFGSSSAGVRTGSVGSALRRIRTPGGDETRYGSGAQSFRGQGGGEEGRRDRERDRDREGSGPRTTPVGPQEANDWASALSDVANNIATLDRYYRSHATTIARAEAAITELQTQVVLQNTQIQELSTLAGTTSKNLSEMDVNITRRYTPSDQLDSLLHGVDRRLIELTEKLNHLQSSVAAAASLGSQPGMMPSNMQPPPGVGPQTYDMTPPHGLSQDERFRTDAQTSPMYPLNQPAAPVQQTAQATHTSPMSPMGPPTRQGLSSPFVDAQPPVAPTNMPGSWEHQAPGGDYGHQARVPNMYGGYQSQPNYDQQYGSSMGQPHMFNAANPYRSMNTKGMMGDSEAMQRMNPALKRFTGEPGSFQDWAGHFIDHMAKVEITWRSTLNWLATTDEDLSYRRLEQEGIGPYRENAASLAMKLEQTIVDWLPERLYKRRVQLCGGPTEQNNGFKMWNRLYKQNKGTGDIIEYAGTETIREYPRCDRIADVADHLDGWQELLDNYGGELIGNAPKMLRSMLLNIIPRELKSEIMKDEKLCQKDYQGLADWCRARCTTLQQESLAEVTRRNLRQMTGSSRGRSVASVQQATHAQAVDTPVGGDDSGLDDAPTWAKALIHAVRQPQRSGRTPSRSPARSPGRSSTQAPPAPHGDRRQQRDRRTARTPSPARGGLKLIDWPSNRCYHCGSDTHTRNDCAGFKKMMEEANKGKQKKDWKPPAGYKSAIAKARDAAKAKRGDSPGPKKVVASLTSGGEETDDDTASIASAYSASGMSFEFGHRPIAALRRYVPVTKAGKSWHDAQIVELPTNPVNAVNRFSVDVPEQEYDADMMQSLNNWAAKVHVKPHKKKKTSAVAKEIAKDCQYIQSAVKAEGLTVKNDKDISKAEHLIKPLPYGRKEIAKVAKKLNNNIHLEADEMLVMIDSGSFTHAADCDRESALQALSQFIKAPTPAEQAEIAETACGGILKKLGTLKVNALVDGETVAIKFDHRRVKVPILSVRRLCKDGNYCVIHKKGGFIFNEATGKRIKFMELNGVYYMRLKVVAPSDQQPDEPAIDAPPQPFARQGA